MFLPLSTMTHSTRIGGPHHLSMSALSQPWLTEAIGQHQQQQQRAAARPSLMNVIVVVVAVAYKRY